jgi:hypothetical protein
MTMKLIETRTLGTAQASIEFTSIPQTFTDLVITISARSNRPSAVDDAVSVKLNGTTTNFTNKILQGTGSEVGAGATFFGQGFFLATCTGASATANTFGNSTVYIPNYTAAINKSISTDTTTENNNTFSTITLIAGLWSNTAPVISILFDNFSVTNFVAGTTISLYGITKGSDGVTTTTP